ncbi:Unannotated [Lentimonas sp. CC19]|nr:Unannotated [Lentimonas sp. CC4]CAA6685418.1 Unannotated [Lentimonas sp. CC6]CAA6690600.1 Unannotated [Lentimonas sp. CC10]CAA6695274.1 Unannotated [Lentimonas sp. CC19]CAA7068857.1 Unannotated [Lentimonas sp. CC11]CAA7170736.1 Unannotated [Lentimonas sp. CC21]CAA7179702.1 Unannotated [Lentimonas sp. CC8]
MIAGVLLFAVGVICVPLAIVLILLRDSTDLVEFVAPGTAMAFVETPGRYYLWHDYQTEYDGRTYHHAQELPDGLEIEMIGKGGVVLELVSAANTTFSSNGRARQSIGYVEVADAGQVTLNVTGDSEPRIVSFSPFSLGRFVGLIVKGVLIALAAGVSSLGLMIWGIVKWANAPLKPACLS